MIAGLNIYNQSEIQFEEGNPGLRYSLRRVIQFEAGIQDLGDRGGILGEPYGNIVGVAPNIGL